ncbi:HBL220Wp [Eremothecium sinecaudum]|uniref:HBL220Wp n=1 Tax=Eremothecium sinecaudum TaxID=45286 RepID=A0A109UWY9_9SACH|nr:HBL220Wp [Eremothecium sinecaudum]AMD18682.1 HBL220Wp [Eremothecium sinecaudum]
MTTNTVIITSSVLEVTSDSFVTEYSDFLNNAVLSQFTVTDDCPLELYVLPNLKRLIVVSPSSEISQYVITQSKKHAADPSGVRFNACFALFDTKKSNYLELPKSKKIRLVSPPQSPPSEFDFDRTEEHPNRETGHEMPAELLDASQPDAFQPGKSYLVHENSAVANIVLHPCENQFTDKEPTLGSIHTMVPPRSIYDDE